jgi:hypothetical protein
VNLTQIYDIAMDTWSVGAPMPQTRFWMAGGYHNGSIYLVSGWGDNAVEATLWRYDVLANTWDTTLAPMPAGRAAGMGAVINGHFYVAGGFAVMLDTPANSLYDYDIAGNAWSARANLPRAVNLAGSAVVGGRFYVFGGDYFNPTNVTQVFNPATSTWSYGPSLSTAFVWGGSAAVGAKIYGLGGATSLTGGAVDPAHLLQPPARLDINGDCLTDWVVVRDTGGVATSYVLHAGADGSPSRTVGVSLRAAEDNRQAVLGTADDDDLGVWRVRQFACRLDASPLQSLSEMPCVTLS